MVCGPTTHFKGTVSLDFYPLFSWFYSIWTPCSYAKVFSKMVSISWRYLRSIIDTAESTFVPWRYGAQCWQWHPGVNICAMTLWSSVLTMTPQSHQWLCNFFYSQMAVLGHTVSGTDFFLWFKPTWIQDSWLKDFYVLQSFKILKIFVGDLFSFLFINMLTLTPKSFLPWPPICQNLVTQSL